jgi:hypothetical protein
LSEVLLREEQDDSAFCPNVSFEGPFPILSKEEMFAQYHRSLVIHGSVTISRRILPDYTVGKKVSLVMNSDTDMVELCSIFWLLLHPGRHNRFSFTPLFSAIMRLDGPQYTAEDPPDPEPRLPGSAWTPEDGTVLDFHPRTPFMAALTPHLQYSEPAVFTDVPHITAELGKDELMFCCFVHLHPHIYIQAKRYIMAESNIRGDPVDMLSVAALMPPHTAEYVNIPLADAVLRFFTYKKWISPLTLILRLPSS